MRLVDQAIRAIVKDFPQVTFQHALPRLVRGEPLLCWCDGEGCVHGLEGHARVQEGQCFVV